MRENEKNTNLKKTRKPLIQGLYKKIKENQRNAGFLPFGGDDRSRMALIFMPLNSIHLQIFSYYIR